LRGFLVVTFFFFFSIKCPSTRRWIILRLNFMSYFFVLRLLWFKSFCSAVPLLFWYLLTTILQQLRIFKPHRQPSFERMYLAFCFLSLSQPSFSPSPPVFDSLAFSGPFGQRPTFPSRPYTQATPVFFPLPPLSRFRLPGKVSPLALSGALLHFGSAIIPRATLLFKPLLAFFFF